MKGNEKLLKVLNELLANELTAINQYMLHGEICNSWGYKKLHKGIEEQAMDEMHHAEWLIKRILFFDGTPTVSKLNPMKIGKQVVEIIKNDQALELRAIKDYNDAITLAREVKDQASVDLLSKILSSEEDHEDWAETQFVQIEQMGLENYLHSQTEGAA